MQKLFQRVFVMEVVIILMFLCNSAFAETTSLPPCPVNEEFSPTGGDMCENCGPSCLALSQEPRCYCKANHSRLNGVCIPTELCPKESETPNQHPCPINEEFRPDGGPSCEDCGAKCELVLTEAKCYCKTNFSRLHGVCIPNFACPPETPDEHPCPENEEFRSGGPECENCGVRCETQLSVAKCYCKSGYWRSNGICVPESDCPKEPPDLNDTNPVEVPDEHPCPDNEEFRPDGGPACENCGPKCKKLSTEAKCYCKTGHSRMNGICILDKKCPPHPRKVLPEVKEGRKRNRGKPYRRRCPVNEKFSPRGGPVCENCGRRCSSVSTKPKCYCKDGFSRFRGKCIPNCQCPRTQQFRRCPPGEEFREVGQRCEYCQRYCAGFKRQPKCYCLPGNCRNLFGKCVSSQKCLRHRGSTNDNKK